MNTYSLNELIKKGINPEIVEQIISEVLRITLAVKDDYPNYKNWFLNTHVPELQIDRDIIFTVYKNEIVGIANIKKSEQKICTLYIKPNFRQNKIGNSLIKNCFENLETTKPLITISSNKIQFFKKIIHKNDWEYNETLSNYYMQGSDEYVFNGTMYLPKEQELQIPKILTKTKELPKHIIQINIPFHYKISKTIKYLLKIN